MFGKKTSKYKLWIEHARILNSMPKDCQVVNTGSTPSFRAFDYSLWSAKGFNLGFQPQPLYYDFETLKKYSAYIKKNAKILIGIEEFKFFVDSYDYEPTDHKYYLWLNKEQIRTYNKNKEWLIKNAPVILHPEFLLYDVKKTTKNFLNKIVCLLNGKRSDFRQIPHYTEADDIRWAQKWVSGWNKEFGWENGQQITAEQDEIVRINKKRLGDMVDYCFDNGWSPYLVVPPFSPNLTKLLSEDILRDGLWKPLEMVSKKKNIPLLNFFYDERFADYKLYSDALTFNDAGRRLFNRIIQEQIGMTEEIKMKEERKTYRLRNEVELPWISYGTGVIWKYTRKPQLFLKTNIRQLLSSIKNFKMNRELYGNIHIKRILSDAYKTGFRMFDSGRIYAHSENFIGEIVSGKPGVFVTTKCSWMDITRSCSPDNVKENLDVSLKNIRRDRVDLYLLHWPEGDWLNIYTGIIEEYKKGRCRAFGVCNISVRDLEVIENAGLDLPMVIQTEIHPFCVKKELREYCRDHGIQLMAHTPTCHNNKSLSESEILVKLREKYNKSSAQIIIRWHYQNNIIPVVSTFSKKHMKENLDIFDFALTEDEMNEINSLDCNKVLLNSHGIDDPNYIYNY